MHSLTLISSLYGQARGYRRLDIRRRVNANQRLSPEALARLNEEGFQRHVHRSIARYPFYAERVKDHRGSLPAPGTTVRPEELPVWTRDDQRAFFAQQERPKDASYMRQTSGSTSLPIRYYVTRESYELRTAIMDRSYEWAHAHEGVRSVYVWGVDPSVHPPQTDWLKRRAHLLLQRRHYFNAFKQFSDEERIACCELINHVKPDAIVGYTGMLVDLARFTRDHKVLRWKARSIVLCAEGLQSGQRELLQHTLAEEVFDSYGSREFMNIGMECEKHHGYHLTTDNLRTEIVDADGMPVPPGKEGRVVLTDFNNAATPFIRYEVGDLGVMMPPDERCPCGRPFPRMASVQGRLQDMIYTPNGPVTAIVISFILKVYDWIEGYQVEQHSRDRILMRLLTRQPLTAERLAPVSARLRAQLGDITIDFERVDVLSRRPSGKFHNVISTITGDR